MLLNIAAGATIAPPPQLPPVAVQVAFQPAAFTEPSL